VEILELLKAVFIGFVEGITEWLPVSSTGHMILVNEFIKLNVQEKFWDMFLVVIQLGAILAVVILFFHKLNPFSSRKSPDERRSTFLLWAKVVVACIPAAALGILFKSWFQAHVFNAVTVACALIFYGVAFIVVERLKARSAANRSITKYERRHPQGDNRDKQGRLNKSSELAQAVTHADHSSNRSRSSYSGGRQGGFRSSGKDSLWQSNRPRDSHIYTGRGRFDSGAGPDKVTEVERLSFPRAFAIGLFQCLAIVPGTSRSGATILGGRILGVSREAAAEFSFFLAIPVMFGWSALELAQAFILEPITLTTTEWGVFAVGFVVAFLVSVVAIKFLMSYIKKHSFEAFGWYRIVLGVVVLAFFLFTGRLLEILPG